MTKDRLADLQTWRRCSCRSVTITSLGRLADGSLGLAQWHWTKAIRQMSDHRTMPIKPSRWSWNRFKDLMHFYIMLGVIPSALVITYVNLFIGPAQLAEIPEGYVPEAHEYFSHPITRWMAKNVNKSYQQEYELMCHHIYEVEYQQKLRAAERRIHDKMAEKQDTQAYYYEPVSSRQERYIRDVDQANLENSGTN
uniref:NADH dehydrogenase [ubiquinone] 1 beta subcomplex subunit 5, mitochondrial n=1 Tax=Daphnia atkinsoni TaxID=342845 RepID=A0A4Y7M284_9CRUS|nr:EOG090X0FIE [Daphnia atkinsoni]